LTTIEVAVVLGGKVATMLAGQTIVGGCVSFTVTVKLQLGPAVVVQLTVVVPFAKNDPDAGLHVTVPQPALVVGAKLTTAPHWPGSLPTVMFAGQVIVHAACTLTVNEQLAVLLDASVAVQVTVFAPTGKQVPDGGAHTTLTPGQLSVGVGVV
jgi:hypothetical protein